ncbi:MAG: endonuclease Q family protein [Kiritimatiellae bacterium]|nr:endonuclease Q family protein [Kiritimatiellia bacterium]
MNTYYADLHIHSKYSRATSPECDLIPLHHWAQLKGISVCGTGDCTHPDWSKTLKESLILDQDNGLYTLKPNLRGTLTHQLPESCRAPVHFMLTGEISSIYKRDNQTRKVHSLILLPSLEAAATLNTKLAALGNIFSDGRPILKVDPRNLLEMLLEIDPRCALIPAHIWTPWFSMLGSKSGFDSIEECFGDLTPHIFAVETGLSSDAPMNHRVGFLQKITLVSNSDIHSPARLGRNATRFFGTPSYDNIMAAIKGRAPHLFGGTVDLFPEEGKYYHNGHRSCGVSLTPEQSMACDNLCPACGRMLTIGVLHRVMELAEKHPPLISAKRCPVPPYHHIIPLDELLSHQIGNAITSKRVKAAYLHALATAGPELPLLIDAAAKQLDALNEAGAMIKQVRLGKVHKTPGFDGIYGRIYPQDA